MYVLGICNDMKNPEYFQFKLQLVSRKIHPFPSRNIKQKYVDECSHVACEKQLLRIFMLCFTMAKTELLYPKNVGA